MRQLSWSLARLIRNDLIEHGFDTFMDVENLDSGEFVRRVLSQIEAREHFIVLLQPGSLDRIGEDDDWLHREIAHALAHGRNVVPVTADGFGFRRDLVLPPDVARLPSLNAVVIQPDYFPAAMERLRTRFLKTPPKPGPRLRDLFFPGPHRGTDLDTETTLSSTDAVYGATVTLYPPHDPCPTCRATGAKAGTRPRVCPVCGGNGLDSYATSKPCQQCRGRGLVVDNPCLACSGSGRTTSGRTLKVRIPAGIKDGQRLRLTGQGGPGTDGGSAGDLYILVHVAKP
jgi:hypothetical protein